MKTAVYIEQGFTQIVLTPENKFEESVLDVTLHNCPVSATIRQACFFETHGGYIRQGTDIQSIMIRIDKKEENHL